MAGTSSLPRLPWRRIAVAIATVLVVAWGIGFLAGLIVRLVL